jgi:hypothetical protein
MKGLQISSLQFELILDKSDISCPSLLKIFDMIIVDPSDLNIFGIPWLIGQLTVLTGKMNGVLTDEACITTSIPEMSTKALVPGNSQRARLTALNVFERFATAEGMTVKYICSKVGADDTGDVLYTVLDKFAMYLAFQESSKGSLLSKNSVASYFGNVKNHLLDLYPVLQAVSGRRLQKIESILDKYCAKRGTDFTHQAPPCTKKDLCALTTAMYVGATTPDDYQDAALLSLLWYLLGRSSDTMCLLKNQVVVFPGENE